MFVFSSSDAAALEFPPRPPRLPPRFMTKFSKVDFKTLLNVKFGFCSYDTDLGKFIEYEFRANAGSVAPRFCTQKN